MDAAAYPTGYRCAPRDRGGLPARSRNRAPVTGPVGTATAGKTGHRGDPRPGSVSKPAIQVSPDSGAPAALIPVTEPESAPGCSPTASACEPYREVIEAGLGKGRNAKAIWQDLVSDHGFRRAYHPKSGSLKPPVAPEVADNERDERGKRVAGHSPCG